MTRKTVAHRPRSVVLQLVYIVSHQLLSAMYDLALCDDCTRVYGSTYAQICAEHLRAASRNSQRNRSARNMVNAPPPHDSVARKYNLAFSLIATVVQYPSLLQLPQRSQTSRVSQTQSVIRSIASRIPNPDQASKRITDPTRPPPPNDDVPHPPAETTSPSTPPHPVIHSRPPRKHAWLVSPIAWKSA